MRCPHSKGLMLNQTHQFFTNPLYFSIKDPLQPQLCNGNRFTLGRETQRYKRELFYLAIEILFV